jgi:hypothetical protein
MAGPAQQGTTGIAPDAADFLESTEEEPQIVEFRLMVGRGVRRLRQDRHPTQQQPADRIGSFQRSTAGGRSLMTLCRRP